MSQEECGLRGTAPCEEKALTRSRDPIPGSCKKEVVLNHEAAARLGIFFTQDVMAFVKRQH